jgi:CIC family chloride channel protein
VGHHAAPAATLLAAIALGKILTTSLTIGSGGSAGLFGPSMVIGGCAAAACGAILERYLPAISPDPRACAIVGMAGFFAAAAKTPFAMLILVCELTGDYRLLVPALWVCSLAYLISDRATLYRPQETGRQSLDPPQR